MFAVYIFCSVVGIPLLLLFAFGGGDVEGELGFDADLDVDFDVGGEIDVAGADAGFGDATWRRKIPVSSYTSFLAFFGGVGVVSSVLGVAAVTTFILAVVLGVFAAGVNTALFSFLRNTESDSSITDKQLEGRIAVVSVPIEAGKRGRVTLDTGGERMQLTAGSVNSMPDVGFAPGDEVVIVRVDGGIAEVMAVDPELRSDS